MNKSTQYTLAASLAAMLIGGCTNYAPDDPNRNTKQVAGVGAALGAATGAIVGYQSGRGQGAMRGALIGGAAGGLVGAGVGRYMDQQQAEFERQLAAERMAHQVEIQRLQDQTLLLTMNNEVSFDFNSSTIKPAFYNTLDKVSNILGQYNRSTVRVVGHTDSLGSENYNMQLSRKRADAVAMYMEGRGVAANRIASEGRGESQPRATNATPEGQALNRRVDILITPDSNIQ